VAQQERRLAVDGSQRWTGPVWCSWMLTEFCIAAFADETASTFCGQ
jgi:hypothetical protein